jgi:hypothetical protein
MIIIAVDSGKHSTKAVTRDPVTKELNKIMFRTKMDETEEDLANDRKSCVVTYDEKKYLIGESAETVDYEKSKAKDVHKIAVYTAIAKLLPKDEKTVILAIGCPLSIFKNVEERKKYEEYFMGEKDIKLVLNKEKVEFTIDKVIVCPESCGIIYSNNKLYSNKMVGVIDIGGLNTNCCVYNNLSPIRSTMLTTNHGANIMTNDLKQEINSRFPEANIQDWQMESIIKEGFIKSHREESAKLIENFFNKHVQVILDECKRKAWDLENIDLVFIGGGSKLLKRDIIKSTSQGTVISDNAEWDNVSGFLVVGELNA